MSDERSARDERIGHYKLLVSDVVNSNPRQDGMGCKIHTEMGSWRSIATALQ